MIQAVLSPPPVSRKSERLQKIAVFGIAAIFAFVLSGASLTQPPVWDGAMSVYPAAIELARTDFDLPRLLELPTHNEGGPNTHSLSAWTLLVAAAIMLFGGLQGLVPILHVVSLAVYGLTVVALFLFIRTSTSLRSAILGTAVAGIFPPLLVQAADIYIDLPVACLTAWSVVAMLRRRYLLAALLITVAVWIKPIGIIFLPLLILHYLRHSSTDQRVLGTVGLSVPPLVLVAASTLFLTPKAAPVPSMVRFAETALSTGQFLSSVPDTFIIIVLTLFVAFWALRRQNLTDQMEIAVFVLLGSLAFAVFNPLLTFGVPLLPRYYIAVVPILIGGLVVQLDASPRVMGSMMALIGVAFALNVSGALYPYKSHATYALAERSFAYQDLLALQQQGVAILEKLGKSRPIYFDFLRYFQFEYPEMGYTSGPQTHGVSIFHSSDMSRELNDLPDRFAMLFEYPTIGGGEIKEIWENALESGATVKETALVRGTYTIYIVEVDR